MGYRQDCNFVEGTLPTHLFWMLFFLPNEEQNNCWFGYLCGYFSFFFLKLHSLAVRKKRCWNNIKSGYAVFLCLCLISYTNTHTKKEFLFMDQNYLVLTNETIKNACRYILINSKIGFNVYHVFGVFFLFFFLSFKVLMLHFVFIDIFFYFFLVSLISENAFLIQIIWKIYVKMSTLMKFYSFCEKQN